MAEIPETVQQIDLTTPLVALREGTALEAVILTDSLGVVHGADYSSAVSTVTLDALLALARRVIEDTGSATLGTANETIFFDWEGQQAICRPFSAGGTAWVLTALVGHGKAHKQATSRLIKGIQNALKPLIPTKTPKIAKTPKPKASPKAKKTPQPRAAKKTKTDQARPAKSRSRR